MSTLSPSPRASHSENRASHWVTGNEISVLPRIFENNINLAVMHRNLSASLRVSIQAQCQVDRAWQLSWLGKPGDDLRADLIRKLPVPKAAEPLVEDIQLLAEAMAYLFDTDAVGLRLRLLNAAMCPRFHCDNLPVRLVTTYSGPGSEWLPESAVNRAGLGAPQADKPEILTDRDAIQWLQTGDIALLKGSGWVSNEGHALVHRSPGLSSGQKRLLLTIDPA